MICGAEGFERSAAFLHEYYLDLVHINQLPGNAPDRLHMNPVQQSWFSLQRQYEDLRERWYDKLEHTQLLATNGWGAGATMAEEVLRKIRESILDIFPFFFDSQSQKKKQEEQYLRVKAREHLRDQISKVLFDKPYYECSSDEMLIAYYVDYEKGGNYENCLKFAEEMLKTRDVDKLSVDNLDKKDELRNVIAYGVAWRLKTNKNFEKQGNIVGA